MIKFHLCRLFAAIGSQIYSAVIWNPVSSGTNTFHHASMYSTIFEVFLQIFSGVSLPDRHFESEEALGMRLLKVVKVPMS